MSRWLSLALGTATLAAAGIVVTPVGAKSGGEDKDKARLEMEVRILGEATAFFANRNR